MLAALPVEHRPPLGLRLQHQPDELQPEYERVPSADSVDVVRPLPKAQPLGLDRAGMVAARVGVGTADPRRRGQEFRRRLVVRPDLL